MSSLVIVDVQTNFGPYTKKMIDSIVNLIEQFRQRNEPIFLVELEDSGRTHRRIHKAVKSYQRLAKVGKSRCNGATEIMDAIQQHKFRTKQFLFCGVNFDVCVKDTARGLVAKHNKHTVAIHLESTDADSDVQPTKKTRYKRISYV